MKSNLMTDPMTDQPQSGQDSRRILTIDGGGIKGTFPASFLATVEEATGKSVADYFDLIVGTSTGGIIALGLGLEWPASDLLDFYEEYGPQIFGKQSRLCPYSCVKVLAR
ncbi:MAG: patatin-like phospholipase family protein [Salinibacter sp.]